MICCTAVFRTSVDGSNQWHGSGFANLTVSILDRVPSSLRLGLNDVLFLVTKLNTLSSSALE